MRALALVLLLTAGPAAAAPSSYDDIDAGIAARNHGDWDNAIAHFDKALAAGDLVADLQYVAHLDRGQAHAVKGEMDSAIADLTICVGQRPDDPQARFLRARLYILMGKPDDALEDVEAVLASDPDDDEAHAVRARAYEVEGNVEAQLKDLQGILARNPKSAGASYDAGIAAVLAGRAEDAEPLFEPMLANPTFYPYAWLWRAMAALKQGKSISPEVSSHLDRSAWPGSVITFYQGQASEGDVIAAANKGEARQLKGQICEANFYIAEWHKLHGDEASAKALFQKAVSDCPKGFMEWYAAQAELKHGS